jgi:hypothetical protein
METARLAITVRDQYDMTDHEGLIVASKTAYCEGKMYDESLPQYFTKFNSGVRSAYMDTSAQCHFLTPVFT